jgi:hypothetical protein
MTVSRAGGDLASNVTRWATQVGIPQLDEALLKKAIKPITVDGLPGYYVDLQGPRGRIVGAIVERDRSQWFFKLRGPDALVGKQKANFQKFLDSFKFDGGR